MGGLFLTVNRLQNGSFTVTSYQRYHAYMAENGYRFAIGEAKDVQSLLRWPEITAWPMLAVPPFSD
jgi:hypothetical protein